MSDPVRVVVVGCGSMARTWVRLGKAHPQIELVGLVDMRREAAVKMAQANDLPESIVFASLQEAVSATGAEAVFDVTVPAAHDKVVVEALGLGCHVLGEKPMSDSLEKAKRMVAAAEQAGKIYAVTQTRRPVPFARRAVQAIRDGLIGDVQEIHSDFFIGARFGGGQPGGDFRLDMAHPLILDMAIHTFDNARQLSGADATRVYCRSWNPRRSWYTGDASATAIFDMQLPDGAPVVYTYRGSWTNEGMQTEWNADWRIVGQKGTLHTDGGKVVEAEVVTQENTTEFFRPLQHIDVAQESGEPLSGHAFYLDEFARCVRSGETPSTHAADNIKSLAMVEACVRSAETGQPVDVTW